MAFTSKRRIFLKSKEGKSVAQLKAEIAVQNRKIAKEQDITKTLSEKQRLSRELFALKNRKLIGAGEEAKRLSQRFGRGILKAGKKIIPVVQKQAKLIRAQQLRDDAIARARVKKAKKTLIKKTKSKGKKSATSNSFLQPIDF